MLHAASNSIDLRTVMVPNVLESVGACSHDTLSGCQSVMYVLYHSTIFNRHVGHPVLPYREGTDNVCHLASAEEREPPSRKGEDRRAHTNSLFKSRK